MSLRRAVQRTSACTPNLLRSTVQPCLLARRTFLTAKPRSPLFERFSRSQQQQKHQKRPFAALTDNQVIQRPSDSAKWTRIAATTAAIVGGAGALTLFNNRETRGSLTAFESSYLNKTFSYVGAGLGITAASAFMLHRSGASYRIMRANPWLVMGVSLVGTIGSMFGILNTAPEKTGQKLFWWTAFNLAQSATLSPLL